MRSLLSLLLTLLVASCAQMHEDTDDCPVGLYLTFTYDYNLERADMFSDHVGAVTVYIFDEEGRYVGKREEANVGDWRPLAAPTYQMHIADLPDGKYRFLVLAGQKSYEEQLAGPGPKFVRSEPAPGDPMTALGVRLETSETEHGHEVVNHGQPLDTLWHGMWTEPVEVKSTRPTYQTISLVRDTKKINVTLRELVNAGVEKCSGICAAFSGADGDYKYVLGSKSVDLRAESKRINAALKGRGGGSPAMIQGSSKAARREIEEFFGV